MRTVVFLRRYKPEPLIENNNRGVYMTQIILWATFICPWAVLFFLDAKRMKRYLSVAFFIITLTSIFWQVGQIYDWWRIIENLPFLTNISAFNYGLLPVTTVLVFYYTFRKPLLFFGSNLVIDAIQAFLISPFLFEKFRLYEMVNMSNFGLFLLIIAYVPVIYFYQIWYERHFLEKTAA
jgi:hypothetical protein